METNILLESGTGEVEILEFVVNNKHYGINVVKVKEVLEIDNLTKLPQSHPSIAGLILCRNEIISLVDLKYVLDKERETKNKFKIVMCEFNKIKIAFSIDEVLGIHRIGWEKVLKPNDISSNNSLVTGNIILNEKIILLLDFEKIVTDINPSTGISEDRIINVNYKDRSSVKLVLADDSPLIRKLLKDTLLKAGFKNLSFFDDGKEALNYLTDLAENKKENFTDDAQILITDIEMPQLDGLTLTRKIKEHPVLNKLPVIIFSSLITDSLRHKGNAVGADAQMSKPDIDELVTIIDTLLK